MNHNLVQARQTQTDAAEGIYELLDELIYLDGKEKWHVDQTSDLLRGMNNADLVYLIKNLNKRILVRR